MKDGVKHTLVHMKEEDATEGSGPKALLLGGKYFLEQMGDKEIKFIIMQRPREVLVHTEIKDFQEEI